MKTIFLCLVFCGVLAVSLAGFKPPCRKQSDCDEDECCLDNMFFSTPYCEKRYQAGEKCNADSLYKPETDLFYKNCPCVQMYECLGKGSLKNGVTVMKNPKCIMPLK